MRGSLPSDERLDCLIVGHLDIGFQAHERALRTKGLNSGDYRNLQMDCIPFRGQNQPYLEVLNQISGTRLHWTEMPQVAPVFLASYLNSRGLKTDFSSLHPDFKGELREALVDRNPRVVAITSTLYMSPLPAIEVVRKVRAANPETHIVVGGPLIDNLHYYLQESTFRSTLEEIAADSYVLETKGEQTLLALIECLKSKDDLAKVKNCYIPWNDRFVFTGKEAETGSIEDDIIEWDRFSHKRLGATVQTRTALSCPFRCTFCDYPVRAGQWDARSIDRVEKELIQIEERGDVRNVVFIDDTFNVPIGRFKEILKMMAKNRFSFGWYSYLRCNLVNREICELMQQSRCAGVFLGIESGDEKVLRNMKKMAKPHQYQCGIRLLNEFGITSFASLIVGFPGETQGSVERTIELINQSRPTFFRGEVWYYNHRSPIHKQQHRLEMEGVGYKWKHASMDWQEACEQAERIFREVDTSSSTWLPMYDFDFWLLPYLQGKGLRMDQIRKFLQRCNRLLELKLEGACNASADRQSALESDLVQWGSDLPLHQELVAAGAPS